MTPRGLRVAGLAALALALTSCAGSTTEPAGSRAATQPAGSGAATTTPAGAGATTPAPASSVTSDAGSQPSATASGSGSPVATTAPTSTIATGGCKALATSMSREEQVGQLFMVGTQSSQPTAELRNLVTLRHVGSVLYLGRQTTWVGQTSRTIAGWGGKVPVLLAADQEGGAVQRLTGPGFDTIPSATRQGRLSPGALQRSWYRWGSQLRDAGVLYDLAPVADVVPAGEESSNAAVGALRRNYGTTIDQVGASTAAVVRGLEQARVASSLKHYPGLGKTAVNTDFGAATDTRTTAADIAQYDAAMRAGASSVMISSTVYQKLDPGTPGVFSTKIITGLLRGTQGWDKVVISDDLGAARSVAKVPAGERGARFLAAGGDLVVDADPSVLGPMVDGVLARAQQDPAFAAQLGTHVARVLALKQSVGLLTCGG